MAAPTDKTMLETWKRQLDAAMRLTEVVIEGSQRMREMQMQAAATAHADAVATQKALAGASSPDELMRIQGRQAAAGGRRGGRRRGAFGYNAASGEYGDLVQTGVLDPCKVTRTALQNASSIAGLILTTDCMIARAPEGPAPGGGAAEMPQ